MTASLTGYICGVGTDDREERCEANGVTAGGVGESSVNHAILVTHSQNPPRAGGKMLLKEEAHDVLRAYDTYCRRCTENDRAAGVQRKLHTMSGLLPYSQKDAILLFYFAKLVATG